MRSSMHQKIAQPFSRHEMRSAKASACELQKPFVHSALWSVIGNASQRFGQWAILIVLAKLGTAELIGMYALALAACNPLMMFSYMQLGTVLAADSTQEYPFAFYWRIRVLLCSIAAVVIVLVSLACGMSALQMLVIFALALAKVFEGLSDMRQGLLKRADRMDLLALTQVIRALVTVVLFVLVFSMTSDLFLSVFSLVCGWAGCLVLVDLPLSRKVMSAAERMPPDLSWKKSNRKQWQPFVASVLPLGLISLVVSAYVYLPQYYLKVNFGDVSLGLFVAVASLPVVLETIARSVAQATIPRFAAFCASRDEAGFIRLYRNSLLAFLLIGTSGVLIAWLWGELILSWLFNPEIADYHSLLLVMALATATSVLCSYASIFVSLKQYTAFLKLWCFGLASLAILGFLLVPTYGVYGAAWAIVASNVIRIALIHNSIYKLLKISFRERPRNPKYEPSRAIPAA